MKKLVEFNADQIKQIQAYADQHCEGNFSFAVRALCQGRLTELKGK